MVLSAKTEQDMHALGSALARCLKDGDVVLLTGTLGAGKTQFAQGVGEGLGISQKLVSPTFNIAIEYESPSIRLNHFDLYRLADSSQLEDIDFYALTDSDTEGASLIEWADLFLEEMPEDRLDLTIDVVEGGERSVSVAAHGPRAQEIQLLWEMSLKEC